MKKQSGRLDIKIVIGGGDQLMKPYGVKKAGEE